VQVEIARPDVEGRIELLPPGEAGEIVVRGHNVFSGYLNRPEETEAVLVDGWFRTGDIGVKDAEGYLSVVDRKKDLIIRGGFNVYPREVEEALLRHPDVLETAVVGRPDERRGQVVVAYVVLREGARRDEQQVTTLQEFVKAEIAPYKCPREIVFLDALPRTPTGKLQRFRLRELPRDRAT
jgi:long-chain acyl-CoA synthetase